MADELRIQEEENDSGTVPPRMNRDDNGREDARWMRQALQLADGAIGLTSPNPTVGCVLVRNGRVLGRGAHHYDTRDHAEIVALREAGEDARGATAYVTLEPCSHTGRTGPCSQALVKAGVARVVVATGDPNPLVHGRGIEILRGAGIAVTLGICAAEARLQNMGFARWIRTGLPFVTVKAGVSLDGRIAPPRVPGDPAGSTAYLTGARSLLAVQKMRHGSDAVLTGIGTVLQDNPLLTDRSGKDRRRRLLRVILDSGLRMPLDCNLVKTAQEDVLVYTARSTDAVHADRRAALEAAGVRVVVVEQAANHVLDLRRTVVSLGEEFQIHNLLVEGGSQLNRALLDGSNGSQIADRLCLFYAPIMLGEAGVPLLSGDQPITLETLQSEVSASGHDSRVDSLLRDPWTEERREPASGAPR